MCALAQLPNISGKIIVVWNKLGSNSNVNVNLTAVCQ